MLRTYVSVGLVLILIGLAGAAGQDTKNKVNQDQKNKAGKGEQATITKVDAKNGTVTVRIKDKNGQEVEKVFKLTEDIRYFDSTGKAIALDIFQNGDKVLVLEAEGRLKEMHHGNTALGGRAFLHAAAEINLAEIKLGHLAQERASATSIKKFGERILADHTKMHKELEQLAKSQQVTLPDKLDKKHQELVDQLAKLKGTEFDRAFAKDLVAGHEKAVSRFEAEAKNGQDSSAKAWAEKCLPTLREHLQMARDAVKEVGANR